MATIRKRSRTDGSTVFHVRVFDKEAGKWFSTLFESGTEAVQYIELLKQLNGDPKAASRTMRARAIKSPLLRDVLLEHVDLLTNAAPDTCVKYKSQIREHFSSELGLTPIEAVTVKHVKLLLLQLRDKGLAAKTIKNLHGLLSEASRRVLF